LYNTRLNFSFKFYISIHATIILNYRLHKVIMSLREQEAQLSQRDRAILSDIEYFTKSLEVTQGLILEMTP